MDIQEAIKRIEKLRGLIQNIEKAIEYSDRTGYGRPMRMRASVWVEDVGDNGIALDREDCIIFLRKTKEKYEAEIARLQPVIDMANAALKGLMT